MKRQITIYESAKNGKITVFNDVECNSLGELKTLLREKGIDYNNKEFVEGVTNTKLLSDESQIPTNIPFKGKTTNDVFINILNKDTKIKSGADYSGLSRSELLREAKPYKDEIEAEFHANYTRVKSSDIATFLSKKAGSTAAPASSAPAKPGKADASVSAKLEALKTAVEKLAVECDMEDEIAEVFADWNTVAEPKQAKAPEAPKSNFSPEDIQSFLKKGK